MSDHLNLSASDKPTVYEHYIALGDSMSIDCYPATDARESGITPEKEIGAAALFYQNNAEMFAEFSGYDLQTLFPDITYENMVLDGATTEHFIAPAKIPDLDRFCDSPTLITLTLGGNDLLELFGTAEESNYHSTAKTLNDICQNYLGVLKQLQSKVPKSTLILTTLFDPSDGTDELPSGDKRKFPSQPVKQFNNWIRQCATTEDTLLADVYAHFLGHGAHCDQSDQFWYWKQDPIEPSYKGASEIRRVWLQALKQ